MSRNIQVCFLESFAAWPSHHFTAAAAFVNISFLAKTEEFPFEVANNSQVTRGFKSKINEARETQALDALAAIARRSGSEYVSGQLERPENVQMRRLAEIGPSGF
jgi:hypothetical protein